MADPRLRTLKIKTGVVKRLTKEKTVYEKEVDQQRERIIRLKSEGKDEYDMRKQDEVLQEALMMVPDCQRRLTTAFDDLKRILDSEQDLKDAQDYTAAAEVLELAKPHLSN